MHCRYCNSTNVAKHRDTPLGPSVKCNDCGKFGRAIESLTATEKAIGGIRLDPPFPPSFLRVLWMMSQEQVRKLSTQELKRILRHKDKYDDFDIHQVEAELRRRT